MCCTEESLSGAGVGMPTCDTAEQGDVIEIMSCQVGDGLNCMFETAIRKVPTVRPMDVADVIGGAI